MPTIRLKKNESFYIREGWFEKAINTIKEKNTNIFYKNDGIVHLGIGSNMVKGLKYWLRASRIIDPNNGSLTEFGELLYENDRYLDDLFSWFLIHYHLTVNQEECPIAFEIFNSDHKQFSRSEIQEYVTKRLMEIDPKVNVKLIDSDVSTFFNSYCRSDADLNPEENLRCPLSRLGLFERKKDEIKRLRPAYASLS